ncbi:MAG: MBL fold metallo-hydrolase [Patescibacteria group bacterium]|jgi:L-ascorbate metabolism protein UlaG (beta-lactamase superfamily)
MYISWHGNNYFKIQNSQHSIVLDPYSLDKNFKYGKAKGDVAIFTDPQGVEGCKLDEEAMVIASAGEYETKDIFVYGLQTNGHLIYLIIFEDVRIAFLGEYGHQPLTDKDLELVSGADILLLPVGGGAMANAKEANNIIGQIEPRLVIPSAYQVKELKNKADGLELFIKEFGIKPEEHDKFKVSARDLPQDDLKLIVLKAQV